MKRRNFVRLLPLALSLPALNVMAMNTTKDKLSIQLIRHATLLITIGESKILVDPMLSPKDALDPVGNSNNPVRFPMVDLPVDENQVIALLKEIDAVFITHTHRDHWDTAAQELIDKQVPIFCQPSDVEKIKQQGFKSVSGIENQLLWKGITIHRTSGKHGTGDIGKRMGEVSGFVFKSGKKSIYVAGDTIWCADVEQTLATFQPSVTIVNAGAAQFLTGDPITMTPADVISVKRALPKTNVIAVHMDTVNHCHIKRSDLRREMENNNVKIEIPNDGEWIDIH